MPPGEGVKMRIYIAGPITGKLEYKKEFKSRERKLRNMGHIVISPAYLPDGLKDYMPGEKERHIIQNVLKNHVMELDHLLNVTNAILIL